jgi:Na+/H+-translocating membrane pyrophosphatase
MGDKNRLAKIAVSFVAAIVLSVRLFKPNLKVDSIVLLLIVIGIVPWLSSLIKSIEFLGFQD